ncbi:alpha/beta hydrolase [Pusillimonas sp. CC-YST705]|uniref:Alpha/beta hydrolase n=1 Tax=Mesopusillimonas faecipullorum TaxID=2755040 RepID=A0ABS8CFH1_9BURK|nr:alpha/beta hydrolase [Mesopusillimonas faecipullorum]MCB5364792.1 alpha/beta hydrolase [Mesopusillimonas faecipullorum]
MPILESGEWRIDYLDEGQGPPVLLIHSASSSYKQWRPLIDTLSQSHRVLAINLYGYGETSPWPADRVQTVADQLEIVLALMDHVPGKLSLVGHSLGAVLAMEAALCRPEQVEKLIMYEPNPFHLMRDHGLDEAFAGMVGLMDTVQSLHEQGRSEEAARHFIIFWSDEAGWNAMSAKRQATLAQAIGCSIHEGRALERNTTSMQVYASLSMPTLLMYAADTNPVIAQVLRLLEKGCPHWQVAVQPEGGHLAPLTHPEQVNAVIQDFLEH